MMMVIVVMVMVVVVMVVMIAEVVFTFVVVVVDVVRLMVVVVMIVLVCVFGHDFHVTQQLRFVVANVCDGSRRSHFSFSFQIFRGFRFAHAYHRDGRRFRRIRRRCLGNRKARRGRYESG